MLTDLCQELHNWFCGHDDVHYGSYTIESGTLSLSFLQTGQYFRIIGSVFNDGVHRYGDDDLTDEEFTGTIWAMRVPQAVLDLDAKITEWQKNNAETVESPYQSESWGGYTYTLKAGGATSSAAGVTWQSVFANDLNRWRKL